MRQSTFFDTENERNNAPATEQIVLYALGEFQARGKLLAARELPLDRLRGALRRAAERFAVDELDDERAVAALDSLGAHIRRVPTYVAKHPFRITVPAPLAERALALYRTNIEHA